MPKRSLTVVAVEKIKPPRTGQKDHFDAGYPGLALRVSYGGGKSWVYFYRTPAGKQRRMTLGRWPGVKLDEARYAWRDARALVLEGRDPAEERKAQRSVPEPEPDTFEHVAAQFRKRHIDKKAEKTAIEYRRQLNTLEAKWRGRPITSIGKRDLIEALDELVDAGKPITANRTHALARRFFNWCLERDILKASPVTGLKAPAPEEGKDRVYTADELAALWHAAPKLSTYEGAYLQTILLTGKRKSALAAMRDDEIGGDGWWRPPQPKTREKRTKLNLPIPLPTPALRIVRALPRVHKNPYVFVGRRAGGHLDPGSALQEKVQAASGVDDFFWHGVRHTVATTLEDLRVPGNAARRFTDHLQPRDAHQGYVHATLEDLTQDAAETWGRYVKLVARRRVWAKVSAHLTAEDVNGDGQSEARRARKREFCGLTQTGGEPWVRWVRGIARPASGANVVPMRAAIG